MKGIRPEPPPMRLFILGARAESSLPREVWHQLAYLFPRVTFHIIFIGPESMANRDSEFPLPERTPRNPFGAVVEDRISPTHQMKVSTIVEYYHTIHEAGLFQPFDPYFDCFVLFHPGLGHPASSHEWQDTIPQLLETKVPIISTGYTEWDMRRDLEWVKEKVGGEMDILMEPGENKFRSLRWDLNDFDPADISCGNWGVWAFRGKRYTMNTFLVQAMLTEITQVRDHDEGLALYKSRNTIGSPLVQAYNPGCMTYTELYYYSYKGASPRIWLLPTLRPWYSRSRRHQASTIQYSQALIPMIRLVCKSLMVSRLTSIDLTDFYSDLSGLVSFSHHSDLDSLSAFIANKRHVAIALDPYHVKSARYLIYPELHACLTSCVNHLLDFVLFW